MRSKVFLIQSKEWVANQEYPPKLPQIKPLTKFSFLPPPTKKKKTGIENFKPKKVLRSSQALEIWSTPPGVLTCVQMFKV